MRKNYLRVLIVGLKEGNEETWAEGFPDAEGDGLVFEGELDLIAEGGSLTAMVGLAEVDGFPDAVGDGVSFEGELDSIAEGGSLTAMVGLAEVDGVSLLSPLARRNVGGEEGFLLSAALGILVTTGRGSSSLSGISVLPRRCDGEGEILLMSATAGVEEGLLLSAALGISVISGRLSSSVVQIPQVRGHFC